MATAVASQHVDLEALDLLDVQAEQAGEGLPVGDVEGQAAGKGHQEDAGGAHGRHTYRDEDGQHDGAHHDDGAQAAQGGEQHSTGHNHDQGHDQGTVTAQLCALFDDVLGDAGLVHQLPQPGAEDNRHDSAAHTDSTVFHHSLQPANAVAFRVHTHSGNAGNDTDDHRHQRKGQQGGDLLCHHKRRNNDKGHNDQGTLQHNVYSFFQAFALYSQPFTRMLRIKWPPRLHGKRRWQRGPGRRWAPCP